MNTLQQIEQLRHELECKIIEMLGGDCPDQNIQVDVNLFSQPGNVFSMADEADEFTLCPDLGNYETNNEYRGNTTVFA